MSAYAEKMNEVLLRGWKSDLSNKIQQEFFKPVSVLVLLHGCTTWILTQFLCQKKTTWELHKDANGICYFFSIIWLSGLLVAQNGMIDQFGKGFLV